MEYVDGIPLDKECPEDMVALLDAFLAIGSGLDAMHEAGFLHCDTKPTNVLVPDSQPWRAKLIDFGHSCPMGHQKTRIQGTPEFIAPEQVDRRRLDARTDVFNFGATMYWALTKQNIPSNVPFTATGLGQLKMQPKMSVPHEVNPEVPTSLSNLVLECCRKSPADRPKEMGDVVSRLGMIRHIALRNGGIERDPAPFSADEIDGLPPRAEEIK
jgi:serine/threonine-protein kinase